MQFSAQQSEAIHRLSRWLSTSHGFFGLWGYAGSGKTTVLKAALANVDGLVMTAPTHKALAVLREKTGFERAAYCTLHSLFKATPHTIGPKVVYIAETTELDARVIVVDECSMVSREMWGWLRAVAKRGVRVVLVGDPAQLPPINETVSEAFNPAFPHVLLTEVMRSNGILTEATNLLRTNIASVIPAELPLGQDDFSEVQQFDKPAFRSALLEAIRAGENVRVLAFTNADVDWANTLVREAVSDASAPFAEGDRVIAVNGFQAGGFNVSSDSELDVISAKSTTHKDLPAWSVKLLDRTGFIISGCAIDPTAAKALKARLDAAKFACEASGLWSAYWDLKTAFLPLRHLWATTIHKSQGSTFGKVFLLRSRLLAQVSDHLIRNMLLYVGASRAANGLYLV